MEGSMARPWAVILGASSGFGAAAGAELAKSGFDIFGVHLDRRGTQAAVDAAKKGIEHAGGRAVFFNTNAAADESRAEVLAEMEKILGQGGKDQVRVLFHSLAFGALKAFVSDKPDGNLTRAQFDMTIDVMANSLVYWTRDLVLKGWLGKDGRIFAMTSSGGTRVWPSYGAVSAAKAALESHCRQLALELAPRGISVNAIRAGVTDTPALRKIPGNEEMIQIATKRNPSGRLTTPEDVARLTALLTAPGAGWLTGNTLGVDGGEDIVG
jgi:NAD(P)-dependent dehydrogenase (short-subunit alcohol dehydrogenase family)